MFETPEQKCNNTAFYFLEGQHKNIQLMEVEQLGKDILALCLKRREELVSKYNSLGTEPA